MEQPSLEVIFGSYISWKVNDASWIISFMNGTQYMYLLEGSEKALLIDTGWGVGNLRDYVERLTRKQIVVANTHFHPDHAAGNAEFEAVYMSAGEQADAPSVYTKGNVPFDLKRLLHQDYKKIYIGEGDEIDLGGRVIKVMEAKPAHCNSSLFFLDTKYGMLFTGDEFESAQTIMYDNSMNPDAPYDAAERIQNMKENAMRLKALGLDHLQLFPNHNGTPISNHYLDDYIGLADAIFAGTAVIEDKLNHPFIERDPKAPEICRVRYNDVSIFIMKAEVMKLYGTR